MGAHGLTERPAVHPAAAARLHGDDPLDGLRGDGLPAPADRAGAAADRR